MKSLVGSKGIPARESVSKKKKRKKNSSAFTTGVPRPCPVAWRECPQSHGTERACSALQAPKQKEEVSRCCAERQSQEAAWFGALTLAGGHVGFAVLQLVETANATARAGLVEAVHRAKLGLDTGGHLWAGRTVEARRGESASATTVLRSCCAKQSRAQPGGWSSAHRV